MKPAIHLDSNLVASDSAYVDNHGVTGQYLNSNGLEGYPEVWGKRANWMELAGVVNGDSLAICMFSHPENLNNPPHWMARDYGFVWVVNPMGSNIYTEGKERNLILPLKRGSQ